MFTEMNKTYLIRSSIRGVHILGNNLAKIWPPGTVGFYENTNFLNKN